MESTILPERFEIIKELGRGSRGVVYLASDHEKHQEIALKVFPFSITDFQNEISALSQLHNPLLVEIYDFGVDPTATQGFLTEEYFEGDSLSRWAGRLSFHRVAEITAYICQVLQFLHQKGFCHGDLKPNNVLINDRPESNIKLVDFGLASRFLNQLSAVDEDSGKVVSGIVSGTLPYMAPELFMEAPIDGRSDLYSLGATLYELVSGHPPFEGRDFSVLIEKHLFEMPMNPVPSGSSMPKEFGFLILKLLNKNPSDRFEEANDVIRALNLQFNFNFPLGPEKPVLSPELAQELQKKHVERLYEWAIRYYKDRKDPESRRLLSQIYYRQGKWKDAESLLDGLSDARIQLLLLQIDLKKGLFEQVAKRGLELKATVSELERAPLLNTIGEALYYLGEYKSAETALKEALSQVKKEGDKSAILCNLGTLYVRDGKLDEAKLIYEQSLTMSHEMRDFQNEGLSLLGLGHVLCAKQMADDAIPYYQQSEAMLEMMGYRPDVAKVKSHLAHLLIASGSLEKGEEKLRQFEEIAREIGDGFLVAYSRLLGGDLLRKKGNVSEAVAAYREGKRLFQELKTPHEEALVDRQLESLEEGIKIKEEGLGAKASEPPQECHNTSFVQRILEINRRISFLQDEDPILEIIIDSLIEFTGAERGYIILREGDGNKVKVTRGMDKNSREVGFSGLLINQVFQTGEPIITFDAMNDERFSQSLSIQALQLRSIACIPFHLRKDVIGAIYLDNRLYKSVFSPANMGLLQAFADQAAIAISNAWVFEELKRTAADVQQLNLQLKEALSKKEMELDRAMDSLVSKQAALELKYRYDEIIGRSPRMMEVFKLLDRVTDSDGPVFLFGESGTGKELLARAIHFNGPRAKNPFVPVNCSAIPETLLEAELFGYTRGAFTGALHDHSGVLARAHTGTLFLDEIGDMPLPMQVKLLRFLEDQVFQPLGSKSEIRVDVRILTASNKDLKELVNEKKFREDLFFRVHGIRISLPPLRERKEDLPALIEFLLEKFAHEKKVEKKSFTREAFELLSTYSWPGNIRELENTVENACLIAEREKITPADLKQKEELFLQDTPKKNTASAGSLPELEERLIRKTILDCHGNLSQAARTLSITRPRLYRLLKKFDFQPKVFQ